MKLKKKSLLALVLIFTVAIAMIGLSGCGKKEEKVPTTDEVTKVLKDNGFTESEIDSDKDNVQTKNFFHEENIVYVFNTIKEDKYIDGFMVNLKKSMDQLVEQYVIKDKNVKAKVIKDDKDGDIEILSKRWNNEGYVIIKNKNTVANIVIMGKDAAEYDKCAKLINDVEKELGYKEVV